MSTRSPVVAVVVVLVLVVVVAGAGACGEGAPKPEAMDPVNADEAAAVARDFQQAMAPCDAERLGALLDRESLMRRAVHKADVKPGEREQLYKGMREGADLAESLCSGLSAGTKFHVLRVREQDGRPTPLLRAFADDGVNYYELELGKSKKDHRVRVVDLYVYTMGEKLSDSIGRLATSGVAAVRSGGKQDDLERMMKAFRSGDVDEARRLIDGFPQVLRDSKQVRMLELQMGGADDPAYAGLVQKFEKDFPGDPSLDLVAIDGFFARRDVRGVLATIDRLDRRVGGDPYLDFFRCTAHLIDPTAENLAAAEAAARRAAPQLPDEENVQFCLLLALMQREDFAAVREVLQVLETRFGNDIGNFKTMSDDEWREFLKSPAFAEMRALAFP